jgi:chromosome segregation ATPase
MLDDTKYTLEFKTSQYREEKKWVKELQDVIDGIQAKFRKLDIRPDKVDVKLKEIAANIQKLKDEEAMISESYQSEVKKAERELEAHREKLPPLKTMIEGNVASIMGDLRPMDDSLKAEIRAEAAARGGVKKSLVILRNRLFFKAS